MHEYRIIYTPDDFRSLSAQIIGRKMIEFLKHYSGEDYALSDLLTQYGSLLVPYMDSNSNEYELTPFQYILQVNGVNVYESQIGGRKENAHERIPLGIISVRIGLLLGAMLNFEQSRLSEGEGFMIPLPEEGFEHLQFAVDLYNDTRLSHTIVFRDPKYAPFVRVKSPEQHEEEAKRFLRTCFNAPAKDEKLNDMLRSLRNELLNNGIAIIGI